MFVFEFEKRYAHAYSFNPRLRSVDVKTQLTDTFHSVFVPTRLATRRDGERDGPLLLSTLSSMYHFYKTRRKTSFIFHFFSISSCADYLLSHTRELSAFAARSVLPPNECRTCLAMTACIQVILSLFSYCAKSLLICVSAICVFSFIFLLRVLSLETYILQKCLCGRHSYATY